MREANPTEEPRDGHGFTLLELVAVVSQLARDDREVVAVVRHLLESGRLRFRRGRGHFPR